MSRGRFIRSWILATVAVLPVASFAIAAEGQERGPSWRIQDATAGVHLLMKEHGRFKVSGSSTVNYALETSGFPQGKSYALWIWDFGNPEGWLMMKDFTADAAGRLVCEHPIPPEEAHGGKNRACVYDMDQLSLTAVAKTKGVPFRAGILSADGTVRAFVRSVPLPLQFKQGGCTLSAEIVSDKADKFLVEGKGFQAGQKVVWKAEMGGTVAEDEVVASQSGTFVVALDPGATGKESGKVIFTSLAKSCKPTLIFKWGPPALK